MGPDDLSAIDAIAGDLFGRHVGLVIDRAPDGASTVVFRIERGSQEFFLRLAEKAGENLEADAVVHQQLAALGVRVPAVVHAAADEPRLGRSFMITEHIGGRPLTATADLAVRVAVIEAAGEDVAVINSISTEGFGWAVRDAATWPPRAKLADYASYVVEDLPHPWPGSFAELFPAEDIDQLEAIIQEEAKRALKSGALAHGDLGLDHIFERDGAYTGLIDFGELRGTEPEFDLGVFLNHSPRADRVAVMEALLRGYHHVAPLPDDIWRRMRVAGALKALRQVGRWLQPDFPHQRDPAALAAFISSRALPALRQDQTG